MLIYCTAVVFSYLKDPNHFSIYTPVDVMVHIVTIGLRNTDVHIPDGHTHYGPCLSHACQNTIGRNTTDHDTMLTR